MRVSKSKYRERSAASLPAVRLSGTELDRLRECAERSGSTLSAWIRRALFRAAGLPVGDARKPVGRPVDREIA